MPARGTVGRVIAKVVRANTSRPSRFHTARRRLMPANAFLELPRMLAARASSSASGPWMVPAAVAYLERTIRPDWAVLELGSGASTRWYAERAGRVISIEHDPAWRDRVSAELAGHGLRNCEVRLVDAPLFADTVRAEPDGAFDLVVVDGAERMACLAAAKQKVKDGGYLVLDDSDWPEHHVADDVLAGWEVRRFVGVKPFPLLAVETTVYRKPRP